MNKIKYIGIAAILLIATVLGTVNIVNAETSSADTASSNAVDVMVIDNVPQPSTATSSAYDSSSGTAQVSSTPNTAQGSNSNTGTATGSSYTKYNYQPTPQQTYSIRPTSTISPSTTITTYYNQYTPTPTTTQTPTPTPTSTPEQICISPVSSVWTLINCDQWIWNTYNSTIYTRAGDAKIYFNTDMEVTPNALFVTSSLPENSWIRFEPVVYHLSSGWHTLPKGMWLRIITPEWVYIPHNVEVFIK